MMYITEANLAQKLVFKGKIVTRNMCYKYINIITHRQNNKIGKLTGYYHFPNMKAKDALKDAEFVEKKFKKLDNEAKSSFNRFKSAVDAIYSQYQTKIIEKIKGLSKDAIENDIEKAVKSLYEKEYELASELVEKYAEDIIIKADDKK